MYLFHSLYNGLIRLTASWVDGQVAQGRSSSVTWLARNNDINSTTMSIHQMETVNALTSDLAHCRCFSSGSQLRFLVQGSERVSLFGVAF